MVLFCLHFLSICEPKFCHIGLLMLWLFFMESWSCICDLLQVIIPSLMCSEIFQTWPPRNLTGWKGSLTQKIQIGRHQCDLTWLKFRSVARSCHSAVLPTHQAHQSRFHGLKVKIEVLFSRVDVDCSQFRIWSRDSNLKTYLVQSVIDGNTGK